jgi:tyrosine-protein phosphatase SIW14
MHRVRTLLRVVAAAVAFFILPAIASAEPAAKTKDIARFLKVDEHLYRGGQPTASGFNFLKQQGVKTIINLREENDEEAMVRSLGMNYIHLPMTVTPTSRIPDEAILKFFKVMNDSANQPVFVHCKRGADRTGAMVGFYRIAVEGWEGARAYKEARDIGMRWWYPRLKSQLYDFGAAYEQNFRTAAVPLAAPVN